MGAAGARAPVELDRDETLHVTASRWWQRRESELAENTKLDYRGASTTCCDTSATRRPLRSTPVALTTVVDLLDIVGEWERGLPPHQQYGRRAPLATLSLAGPRISELTSAQRARLDLHGGRLRVGEAKIAAAAARRRRRPRPGWATSS